MKKLIGLLSFFLLMPCISFAATGNVLFNCTFEGAGTLPQVWIGCGGSSSFSALGLSSGTLVTGGHDGGKAVSFYYPNSGGEVFDPMLTNSLNKPEVTIVYWEKFDVDPSTSNSWNVKGVRAWSTGSDYIGGTISLWDAQFINIQHVDGGATLATTPAVTSLAGAPDYDSSATGYCRNNAGSTGGQPDSCTLGRYAAFKWAGYGTSWHKVRMYVKQPTNPAANSNDGIVKMWMDEVLLATITGANGLTTTGTNVGQVSFHPSDDYFGGSGPPFHHLYDDITIYEGLVPPSSTQGLAAPTGLLVVAK